MQRSVCGPAGISVSCVFASLLLIAMVPAVHADPVTSWAWQTPGTASGPGAFRATVDFGADNTCDVTVESTAAGSAGPYLWLAVEGSGWGMISGGYQVQVHAAGAVDTRDVTSGEGQAGLRMTFSGSFSGARDLTIQVADMDGWLANDPDPWFPARFDVACDAPISVVGFAGSTEVLSFSHETMEGTGASGNAILVGAGVNVEESVGASFTSASVEVYVADWVFEGPEVITWTLDTPSGLTSGQYVGVLNVNEITATGPAGDYSFSMTRAAVGVGFVFNGWMSGFDPVASLDDVLA